MQRPWKNRLIVRFLFPFLSVILILFGSFYFYSGAVIKDFYVASLSRKMQQEARVLSRLLPTGLEGEALNSVCSQLAHDLKSRLTVIALDGKVLCDSDRPAATMEDHKTRPEVVEALSTGTAKAIRFSTTVGYEMLYQAVLDQTQGGGRIIRISVPLDVIDEATGSIHRALLIGLILVSGLGFLLAFFFSRNLSRRVKQMVKFSQEVAQGSFLQELLPSKARDELSVLETNLSEISRSLQGKMKETVAEKEKAESILRGMTEGVLAVDRETRVILINRNAQDMFSLPRLENYAGASLTEISRHPEMKKLMEDVLACDCSTNCFTKEICLDERWFRVNAISLRDGEGEHIGYVLVFHDVTELKRLETVRSDFVANVSHELRTPLTAIRGYAETLLRNPPTDPRDGKSFLNIIQRHSERLGRLIDDLLTLSDLESGKITLSKEKLEAIDLIRHVLEILQGQAQKKGITLSFAAEPHLPAIIGDPDRLQQLLINLVDNAIKYTPVNGQVKVTAAHCAASQNPGSPMMEIAVTDTGYGIPEKDLPRLTERFYRVDKARSRELGGTGLGLAIVRHIVQVHGGLLKIESQMQKGTTIRVFLPASSQLNSYIRPSEI